MDSNVLQAQAGLWNLIFGYLKTMSLKCALDLGIPDAISDNGQPMTLDQLHSALSLPHTKKPYLRRLMRLLTHFGFFIQKSSSKLCTEAVYDLTTQSRLVIQKDSLTNLLPFVRCAISDLFRKPSFCMGDWFRQDSELFPFEFTHGLSLFDMTSRNPEVDKMLNDAMIGSSCLFKDVILKNGGDMFKGIESLVDVGGGKGAIAQVIAENFPHVRCTVLDLPHMVHDVSNDGIVKFVSGDMFNYVPPADAVLLKWVLHDWGHEDCIRILRRCKDAIPSREAGGKVIVLEGVVGSTSAMVSEEPQLLFDMALFAVMIKGGERDENEWKCLFMEAGFSSYKITHTIGFMSIIEVYP